VFDRGFLIYDHSGKIARMVGSMQDITDKKELEKKLLKQQVDKQKLIAQAVVNAQEKERAEIGKELHDNVNQILSTAKLYLELAETDNKSRINLIKRSTNNISDAINEIRTISRSLVPPSIGDLGLIDSVQDLVENIKATRRLHVEFYYSGTIDNILDEKRKLMLFRIIQEQVNNVLKHAAAKNLVIELIADSEGHAVDLTISDDGKGFELDKVRSKKGVGLSNIGSRAQLFNGSVHIVTALGEGCKLKINVPISNI
jgi:signal transduction histidine kinase